MLIHLVVHFLVMTSVTLLVGFLLYVMTPPRRDDSLCPPLELDNHFCERRDAALETIRTVTKKNEDSCSG